MEDVHGGKSVLSVCFSGDGRLASGGADGSIVLFDASGRELRRLKDVHAGRELAVFAFVEMVVLRLVAMTAGLFW